MQQDEAIPGMSIASLSLQPGDSVRVLFSVLENRATLPDELQIATATASTMATHRSLLSPPVASLITTALTPLTTQGHIGSAQRHCC